MRYMIEPKLARAKSQYYLLRVFAKDGSIKIVHTSESINYLRKLIKERYSK